MTPPTPETTGGGGGSAEASPRRMVLVPADVAADMGKLARWAVEAHDAVTHYGTCDVCELVKKWRGRLRDGGPFDAFGIAKRKAG